MTVPESARSLLRLAVIVLCAAALAGGWEVLASQAPGSPIYIGVLPGPVAMLRETALLLGLLLLASSMLVPERALPRALVLALHVSVALTLLAALYGALTGMHGIQLRDLRPDATPLFILKYTGRLGVLVCLLAVARRALQR
jgi:hypothetical protein